MSTTLAQIQNILARLGARLTSQQARERLAVKPQRANKPQLRTVRTPSELSVAGAWRILNEASAATDEDRRRIADSGSLADLAAYGRNIENFVGTVKVPLGVIGPLRVNGIHAQGDYYVPLATTEAALVASYGRGAMIVNHAGGVAAALASEAIVRAPGFALASLAEAGLFAHWVVSSTDMLRKAAESTSHHCKLIELAPHIEGDHVYLACRYTTGDAAGQNMATFATDALCRAIAQACPIRPRYWFLEANFSGDKKASAMAFLSGRGRKVVACATLPKALVEKHLHTSIERMHDYWRMSALGGVMSGTIGTQGHYANGLAALYIATGQDAACVAESSVGVTRMELRGDELFVAATLPNLVLGTVGGGTGLPTQSAGLRIMGLQGAGFAATLAEVAAALCLCGEISLIGALASGQFAQAHRALARDR